MPNLEQTNILSREFTPEHKAALRQARNSRETPTRQEVIINGVTYHNKKAAYDKLGLNFYSLSKLIAEGKAKVVAVQPRARVAQSIIIAGEVYPTKSAAYRALGLNFYSLAKLIDQGEATFLREVL